MKYLYKAMENLGDSSGNAVLGWHEKVRFHFQSRINCLCTYIGTDARRRSNVQLTEVAGIGCIVRVMTDRRRV